MDGYRDRIRPFSEVKSERTRSNSQKFQKVKFWLSIKKKTINMKEVAHRNMLLREAMASCRLSKLKWTSL